MLEAVAERGRVHRADLADAAGLTQAAAAEALSALLTSDAVAQDGDWLTLAPAPGGAPVSASDDEGQVIRVTIRRRFSLSSNWTALPEQIKVEAEGADPDEIAEAIRAARRELGVARRRKADDADRLARLAPFVREHGCGVESLDRWNRGYPDDRYEDRRSFWRAAQRALDSSERRVGKLVRSRVSEARELGEPEAVIPLSEMLAAAGGDSA